MIRLDYLAVFDIGGDDFVLFRLFKLINDGVAHLVKQSFQLLLELGGIPRLHHKTALCRRKSVKRGVFVELNEIIIVKRLEIGNIHLFYESARRKFESFLFELVKFFFEFYDIFKRRHIVVD